MATNQEEMQLLKERAKKSVKKESDWSISIRKK